MQSKPKQKSNSPKAGYQEAEFEGNSTEQAINKAEKSLGIDREHLEIKVVCEEERGLFGMKGAKSAKIKVLYKKP
jgi:predicted RNA-binding protein Jag